MANPQLRHAIDSAKAQNMRKDNVDRAIKKGTGDMDGVNYEEIMYEGYGPGGVAVMVECFTEYKNRTIADVRYIFNKAGGNVGTDGCVAWMFDKKGVITISKENTDEETLMEVALDAGAEDIKDEGDSFDVLTAPEEFDVVKDAIDGAQITYEVAEISMVPQNTTAVSGKEAEQMIRFMEALDDCDDIQNFYTNADIPDEAFEAM